MAGIKGLPRKEFEAPIASHLNTSLQSTGIHIKKKKKLPSEKRLIGSAVIFPVAPRSQVGQPELNSSSCQGNRANLGREKVNK